MVLHATHTSHITQPDDLVLATCLDRKSKQNSRSYYFPSTAFRSHCMPVKRVCVAAVCRDLRK